MNYNNDELCSTVRAHEKEDGTIEEVKEVKFKKINRGMTSLNVYRIIYLQIYILLYSNSTE